MIQSFDCPETEKLFLTEKSRPFGNIARVALRKLIQLNQASKIDDRKSLPATAWKPSKETSPVITPSESTTNGASSSSGLTQVPAKSQS